MAETNTPGPADAATNAGTTRNTPSPVEQTSPTPTTTKTPIPDKQIEGVPRDQPRTPATETKRKLTAVDFVEGQAVSYVPNHAKGDLGHEDVEHGVVTSTSVAANLVFVRFGAEIQHKSCYPDTLVHQFKQKAPEA